MALVTQTWRTPISLLTIALLITAFLVCSLPAKAETILPDANQSFASPLVGSVSVALQNGENHVAPGDYLPVSVRVENFGSQRRVDVDVYYKIFNNADKDVSLQKEVYSESETIIVDTTISYIKDIQVPYFLQNGYYTIVTELHYPDQETPTTSKFGFVVERKYFGLFLKDLLVYILAFLGIVGLTAFTTYTFGVYRRATKGATMFDYGGKPKQEIMYYQILSDIIAQMRLRIGNNAIKIARTIPEIVVNGETGYVEDIKGDPAKIISQLVSMYEKFLGKPLSFEIRGTPGEEK